MTIRSTSYKMKVDWKSTAEEREKSLQALGNKYNELSRKLSKQTERKEIYKPILKELATCLSDIFSTLEWGEVELTEEEAELKQTIEKYLSSIEDKYDR